MKELKAAPRDANGGADVAQNEPTTHQLLQEMRARSVMECSREVELALKKHGCKLVPEMRVSNDGRIIAAVQLVSE